MGDDRYCFCTHTRGPFVRVLHVAQPSMSVVHVWTSQPRAPAEHTAQKEKGKAERRNEIHGLDVEVQRDERVDKDLCNIEERISCGFNLQPLELRLYGATNRQNRVESAADVKTNAPSSPERGSRKPAVPRGRPSFARRRASQSLRSARARKTVSTALSHILDLP